MLINSFSSFVIISWCCDAGILGFIEYSDEISFNRCIHIKCFSVCIRADNCHNGTVLA